MPLVDTHCHIDLYSDPRALARRVEAAQIYTIAVTNAPSVFRQTRSLAEGNHYIRPALGLHPQLAVQRASELHMMWRHLDETRYVGEIGLDYATSDPANRSKQREVFEAILTKCHESADKILTIHSRRAAGDVVEIIGEGFRGTVILHWYSGSKHVLEKAIGRGFYFSINTAMVSSARSRNWLKSIPRQYVLTETDGPFISTSGKPAQPGDVASIVQALAKIWHMTEREARQIVYENFARLLRERADTSGAPAARKPQFAE